jgi:hypothetical protein
MLMVFAINAIVDIHFQMDIVFYVNLFMPGARAVLMEKSIIFLLVNLANLDFII